MIWDLLLQPSSACCLANKRKHVRFFRVVSCSYTKFAQFRFFRTTWIQIDVQTKIYCKFYKTLFKLVCWFNSLFSRIIFFVIHLAIRYNINCKRIKSANVDPGRKGGGKKGGEISGQRLTCLPDPETLGAAAATQPRHWGSTSLPVPDSRGPCRGWGRGSWRPPPAAGTPRTRSGLGACLHYTNCWALCIN